MGTDTIGMSDDTDEARVQSETEIESEHKASIKPRTRAMDAPLK